MRRFRFRLERLLSYRRSLTSRERLIFGTKVGALVGAEEHASRMRGVRNATLLARLRALDRGLTSLEMRNLHEHVLRIDEAIVNADVGIIKAKDAVNKARGELTNRMKDEKVIENFRLRRWKAWLVDYYRDEGRILDDIATTRHVRQAAEPG